MKNPIPTERWPTVADVVSDHVHRHLVLDTGNFIWHTHKHTCGGPLIDFNQLHHHAPLEHQSIPLGDLVPVPRDDRPVPG